MKEESWERAAAAFEIESDAIAKAAAHIDREAFARAVDALGRAERIAASGCGHSGIACMHFAHSMCCIERPARFLSPSEASHGASGFLKAGDVLVLASRGGATSELIPVLAIAKEKGVVVIGITQNAESPIARDADIWIPMHVTRECDREDTQGTSSFIVLSAIFDALQTAMIVETGFSSERFAVVHPGGAVGARLNEKTNRN